MNYIDLFAGAGGLSEGFIQAGFAPVAHVEMDEAACYSLRTRAARHYLKNNDQYDSYVAYLKGEITRKDLYSVIPDGLLASVINLPVGEENNMKIHYEIEKRSGGQEVDVIIGGPPCQAYSLVGRARSENGMKDDPRNYLYIQYGQYLERYQPKVFVFENVSGLRSAGNGVYLRNMEHLFNSKGYKIQLFTINASDFGVLQSRKRIILIGWRNDRVPAVPDFGGIRDQSNYKVGDLFGDLPVLQAGEGVNKFMNYTTTTSDYLEKYAIRNGFNVLTQHVGRPHTEQDKSIYRIAVKKWDSSHERLAYNDLPDHLKTHSNRSSFSDRFKVVAGDLPWSHTIVAHIAKDGHYYIHPDIKQNRSITVREAARLQSFPDDYYFEGIKEGGSRTGAFRQIGNAVPPLMAKGIAEALRGVMEG